MTEYRKISVPKNFYTGFVKRLLDILISFSMILILSPLYLLVILLELIIHGRPIFYVTVRPGKDAKPFRIYKFRSMTNERRNGVLLSADKRLTQFGILLRKTSIDELPQLFCVLKGDMSIIGPRPLYTEYLDYYNPYHAQRHMVRPGFCCAGIIPTKNKSKNKILTWGDQFDNDIYYIEHLSFKTDIKMLFALIKEVLKGAEFRAQDTRVPFMGEDTLYETRTKAELGIVPHYRSADSANLKK